MDSPRPSGPPPLQIAVGDSVQLRRAHPCGGRDWRVFRVGADIGLACATCGRRVMLDRRALDRRVLRVTADPDVSREGAR